MKLILPQEREQDHRQQDHQEIQPGQQQYQLSEPGLYHICKGHGGDLHQEHQLRNDQRKTHNGHQGRILLGPGRNGRQEGEYQAQAEASQAYDAREGPGIVDGIAHQQEEEQHAHQAHHHHQPCIEQQFAQHKIPGARNSIEVQHPAPALRQETLGHSIHTNEKLDHPEQSVPDIVLRMAHGQVQHKDGAGHIEYHTIESVLLPDLQ